MSQKKQDENAKNFAERGEVAPIFYKNFGQYCRDEKEFSQFTECELSPIYPDDKAEINPAVITLNDTPVMSIGDISLIAGPQKSFKTSLFSLLCGALLNENPCSVINGLNTEVSPRVVYIDTEQSRKKHALFTLQNIYEIGKREHSEKLDIFHYYPLRSYTPPQRAAAIERVIIEHRPNIVFLDGVGDIMQDTNDNGESEMIVSYLSQLAEEYNCHITTIIHTNPNSSKPRGHIGSALLRKCETTLSTKKQIGADGETEFAEVFFENCRNKTPHPFNITRNDKGVPVFIDGIACESEIDKILRTFGDNQFTIKDFKQAVDDGCKNTPSMATIKRFLKIHCENVEWGKWKRKEENNVF